MLQELIKFLTDGQALLELLNKNKKEFESLSNDEDLFWEKLGEFTYHHVPDSIKYLNTEQLIYWQFISPATSDTEKSTLIFGLDLFKWISSEGLNANATTHDKTISYHPHSFKSEGLPAINKREQHTRNGILEGKNNFSSELIKNKLQGILIGANLSAKGDISHIQFNARRTNFSELDLSYINLGKNVLEEASFARTTLVGCNLQGANLQQTNFSDANLEAANLSQTKCYGKNTRFVGTNLNLANLNKACFNEANLSKAKINQASLKKTGFVNANLEGAELQQSLMPKVGLDKAVCKNASFQGSVMTEAHIRFADLTSANFSGTNLFKTQFQGSNAEKSNFKDADLTGTNLQYSKLNHADLQSAKLVNATLNFADLEGANLKDTDMSGVSLVGIKNLTAKQLAGAINIDQIICETKDKSMTYDAMKGKTKEQLGNAFYFIKNLIERALAIRYKNFHPLRATAEEFVPESKTLNPTANEFVPQFPNIEIEGKKEEGEESSGSTFTL